MSLRMAEEVEKVLDAVLRGEMSREQAAKKLLEIYTSPAKKPKWLEEILADLILIDERPEHGAPTDDELREALKQIQLFRHQHSCESM